MNPRFEEFFKFVEGLSESDLFEVKTLVENRIRRLPRKIVFHKMDLNLGNVKALRHSLGLDLIEAKRLCEKCARGELQEWAYSEDVEAYLNDYGIPFEVKNA